MPRFTTKDLLLSMTLIAIGLAAILSEFANRSPGAIWPGFGRPIVGAAAICAGLFAPLKKVWIGAIIGAVTGALLAWVVRIAIGAYVIMRM